MNSSFPILTSSKTWMFSKNCLLIGRHKTSQNTKQCKLIGTAHADLVCIKFDERFA